MGIVELKCLTKTSPWPPSESNTRKSLRSKPPSPTLDFPQLPTGNAYCSTPSPNSTSYRNPQLQAPAARPIAPQKARSTSVHPRRSQGKRHIPYKIQRRRNQQSRRRVAEIGRDHITKIGSVYDGSPLCFGMTCLIAPRGCLFATVITQLDQPGSRLGDVNPFY